MTDDPKIADGAVDSVNEVAEFTKDIRAVLDRLQRSESTFDCQSGVDIGVGRPLSN